MLLEGVRMINHLKSKILITGCNFCYLRTPLVSGKEGKISQVILLKEILKVGRERGKGEEIMGWSKKWLRNVDRSIALALGSIQKPPHTSGKIIPEFLFYIFLMCHL